MYHSFFIMVAYCYIKNNTIFQIFFIFIIFHFSKTNYLIFIHFKISKISKFKYNFK
ncbi:hypothetical protein C672_2215 [[Clostridium] bifermentans ATCC 638]|uniref:Uncharacterized protein n=1 Tax=Paraclostridium bifermentans ATCC 638 = DSM 14991 TaxID=1233171 RepID=T4VR77_PARBF|nr:hypothetical protein C672_2215 [[Clostridium] bifermentans ATCC 638] [Paraclostridium bifermentans ATCC 638 = DSM 14991]